MGCLPSGVVVFVKQVSQHRMAPHGRIHAAGGQQPPSDAPKTCIRTCLHVERVRSYTPPRKALSHFSLRKKASRRSNRVRPGPPLLTPSHVWIGRRLSIAPPAAMNDQEVFTQINQVRGRSQQTRHSCTQWAPECCLPALPSGRSRGPVLCPMTSHCRPGICGSADGAVHPSGGQGEGRRD